MEALAVKAAGWAVSKALAPVTGGLLEAWAASEGLGPNVDALKEELLYANAMLENSQGREIHSGSLKELLGKLRHLAYDADDVLDELEYFRIQDELDGTYHAADKHAGSCVQDLILHAQHTAKAVVGKLKPSPSSHDLIYGEREEQDNNAKHGCLSRVVCCSCGGGTVSSSPPSPAIQDDQNKVHGGCMQKLASNASISACPAGNGRGFSSSCSVLPSKVKGYLCGKLQMISLCHREHWNKVLESKEWELQTNDNDIMPALRLSYDYLPFHLQQCFYYCALFPEDYEFESKELVLLWIGLDIVQPCDMVRRTEDVGSRYLDDLVNHGFLKMNKRNDGSPYYVVHDLLHDLAMNISSFECLSICSSNVKSIHIRQDIRHLSIIIDDKDVEDIKTFKYYKNDLIGLDKRLNIENLRTLMVFGGHHDSFARTFCDLFEKTRALRAIYLFGASSFAMKDILKNFPKLIHLRYLRIKQTDGTKYIHFNLSALTRLYHFEVIDMQQCKGCYDFTRYMSNLAKLRHFLVPQDKFQLHSNIVEVGKLKLLQELRRFEVGRETKGFKLSQLGQLSELGGSLFICNLERIQAMEDAHEARLIQKKHLHKLTLEWDANRPKEDTTHEENVLEILTPCSNLKDLCIRGHGGTKCPKWLGRDIAVKNLESLHLDNVFWENFPPIGEMWMVNAHGEELSGCLPHNRFQNLRRLEFNKLPRLKKWVVRNPCNLFSHLEVLIITHCSELTELSFSHSICCQQQKEAKINWFPKKLRELKIEDCPKLLSFPPVPWTRALCSAEIERVGSGLEKLVCKENYESEYSLEIKMKGALVSELWNVLAFENLTELKDLQMDTCPPLPLCHVHEQELSSPNSELQELETDDFAGVLAEPICTLLSSSLTELTLRRDIEVERFTKEQEDALQLLTSLEEIRFWECDKLQGLPAGLHGLPNLKRLSIFNCPAIRTLPKDGFPSSLQELEIDNCPGIQSLPKDCLPTSLQKLEIERCPAIRSLPKDCLPSSLQKLEIDDCPAIRSLPKVNDLPSSLRELNVRESGNEELRRQCRKLIGIIPVVYA